MGQSGVVRPPARRPSRASMALPFPLTLALRYLRSTRRDAFVSLLSVLAAGGIGLGVAALVLVLAGLSGLQAFLREDVLARTPHIEIELPRSRNTGAESDPMANTSALLERVAAVEGVEQARELLRGRGWVLVGGSAVAVSIVGYEGELPAFFAGATGREEGLYLGGIQAAAWGFQPGDAVEIVSPRPTLTPFGPAPRVHRLTLAGTFLSGQTEQEGERRLAVPLPAARRLLGDRALRVEVTAASLEQALEVAERVEAVVPEAAVVRTWQDLNRPLFFALRLEKSLMFVSVFLIVPVAAMALITVLVLLIASKRGEIGMLRAMGATANELRGAFLGLGLSLGALGLTLGTALGVAAAWVLDRYELLSPPGDVYFIEHIPFVIQGQDLLLVIGAAAGLMIVSSVYGAQRAALLEPVEALRR